MLPADSAATRAARPTGWLVPAVAAVAVGLLISVAAIALNRPDSRQQAAGTVRATASSSAVPPLQSCPASIPNPLLDKQPYLPADATVADAGERLVPRQQPVASLLCGYPTPVKTAPANIGLEASRRIRTGLEALAGQLSWLPPANPTTVTACGEEPTLQPRSTYLLQLVYSGGATWVSLPASQCGTSIVNGKFAAVVSADALNAAAVAYRTGSWPAVPSQPNVCSGTVTAGRLGQQSAMAPSDVASMSICRADKPYLVNASSAYGPILDELHSLAAQPSTETCVGTGNGGYAVRLDYQDGPAVDIRVTPGCRPSVDNGSLQATASARLLSLLAAATSASRHR
jgi:hypothetical protein